MSCAVECSSLLGQREKLVWVPTGVLIGKPLELELERLLRSTAAALLQELLQVRWSGRGCREEGMIPQVPVDHNLSFGSLLLKGERFILLFSHRGIKAQRRWQGMGAALPTHGFPAR